MTYLTGSSILTGKDFAIHNNSTTYTCSKRNHNDIVKTASAATPMLTKSCNICIITNGNRQTCLLRQIFLHCKIMPI